MADEKWNEERVAQVVKYFNDTSAVGEDDKPGLAKLAVQFERFHQLVEGGGVEDGKAKELAEAFLQVGSKWLADNPEVAQLKDKVWTRDKVEKTIAYFNDTNTVPQTDTEGMKKLVGQFKTFEQLVAEGWVEDGDAKLMADEFLKVGKAWFGENPEFQKIYEA